MKKLHFALVGAAALALSACGSQGDDTLGENVNDNMQSEDINALADNAALDAETEALGAQQNELAAEPEIVAEPTNENDGVTTEPSEVEDDVQGM